MWILTGGTLQISGKIMQHAHRFCLITSLMRQILEMWVVLHCFLPNIDNIKDHLSHATKYFSILDRRYFLHFPGRSTPCRMFSLCIHEVWWWDQHHHASCLSCTSFHRYSNWCTDDVSMCMMLGVTFVIIISQKNKCRATGAPAGGNQKTTMWPWCLQSALRWVVAWHTIWKPSLLFWESQYSSHFLHYADSLLWMGFKKNAFGILPAVARISMNLFHAGEVLRVAS